MLGITLSIGESTYLRGSVGKVYSLVFLRQMNSILDMDVTKKLLLVNATTFSLTSRA